MRRHNIFSALLIMTLISCQQAEIEKGLFQLEAQDVKFEQVEKLKFKKTAVDAMMFEKSFGNTTVYYEFDTSLSKLLSKSWTMDIQSNFVEQIKNLFNIHEVYLMVPQSYEQIEIGKTFCVKGYRTNLVFFCTIEKRDGYTLDVMYYYPQRSTLYPNSRAFATRARDLW